MPQSAGPAAAASRAFRDNRRRRDDSRNIRSKPLKRLQARFCRHLSASEKRPIRTRSRRPCCSNLRRKAVRGDRSRAPQAKRALRLCQKACTRSRASMFLRREPALARAEAWSPHESPRLRFLPRSSAAAAQWGTETSQQATTRAEGQLVPSKRFFLLLLQSSAESCAGACSAVATLGTFGGEGGESHRSSPPKIGRAPCARQGISWIQGSESSEDARKSRASSKSSRSSDS